MFIPLQDIIYHTNILTICVQFLPPNSAAVVITGEEEDLPISNIMLYMYLLLTPDVTWYNNSRGIIFTCHQQSM